MKRTLCSLLAAVFVLTFAVPTAWGAGTSGDEPVGFFSITLDTYDAEGAVYLAGHQETNGGDFVADAFYHCFTSGEITADAAFVSADDLATFGALSDVVYDYALEEAVSPGQLCLYTLTGQQIWDALEWGARGTPVESIGAFLHVSGLTYAVDSTVPSTVQTDGEGNWCGAPEGDYRVSDVEIYDRQDQAYVPLDTATTYTVAAYRAAPETFPMLAGAETGEASAVPAAEALRNYTAAFPEREVAAQNSPLLALCPNLLLDYGTVDGSGRITVKAGGGGDTPPAPERAITIDWPSNSMGEAGQLYCIGSPEVLGAAAEGALFTVSFLQFSEVMVATADASTLEEGQRAILLEGERMALYLQGGNFAAEYGLTGYDETDGWTDADLGFPLPVTIQRQETTPPPDPTPDPVPDPAPDPDPLPDTPPEPPAAVPHSNIDLTNTDAEGTRLAESRETSAGDFSADALYHYFEEADVALIPSKSMALDDLSGELFPFLLESWQPTAGTALLVTVSGQQLLDALEWANRTVPTSGGDFLQVGGLTFTVRANREFTGAQSANGWVAGPAVAYRVGDVNIYHKEAHAYVPLDVGETYRVALYSETLQRFPMLQDASALRTEATAAQVLAAYLDAFPQKTVEATNSPLLLDYPGLTLHYGKAQGRISLWGDSDDGPLLAMDRPGGGWIDSDGTLPYVCSAQLFTSELGFSAGDLVTVAFANRRITVPVVPHLSLVDPGEAALVLPREGMVSLAVREGSFAERFSIAQRRQVRRNSDWVAAEGVAYPVTFHFTLAERGGYAGQLALRQLQRSDARQDYPHLTDGEFANFRPVDGPWNFYRASSPFADTARGRLSAAEVQRAGVVAIWHMGQSAAESPTTLCLPLPDDITSPAFRQALATGLRFLSGAEGPRLLCCEDGVASTGLVAALLQCLAGRELESAVAGYMQSYVLYSGLTPASAEYDLIAEETVLSALQTLFQAADLTAIDLQAAAEAYFLSLGLTAEEISALLIAPTPAPVPAPNPKPAPPTGDGGVALYALTALLGATGAIRLTRKRRRG